ncbi:RAIN protein, partial [Rhinopomastus cyanomelas]|nr:RAIN protein [Rhinopomastus cyanomelas]
PPSRDSVELRPPGKAKPPRHKRLSNLFHRGGNPAPPGPPHAPSGGGGRWASEKKLSELDPAGGEDPPEEEGPPQLPGVLKIFGGDLSRGANYKSVLATPRSTARQLVREALERYGVRDEDEEEGGGEEGAGAGPGGFVLCDVVGRAAAGGGWLVEHLRAVGDGERPLVLQEVWKPKAGCSRRFEIRRRREVERLWQGEEGDGAPSQSRRLQQSRCRAASGGPAPAKDRSQNLSLRRSISDLNLSTRRRRDRKAVLSVHPAPPGPEGPPDAAGDPPAHRPDGDGEGDNGGPSLELLSQCLIQPPKDRPYFLLLQGYGHQEFVLYIMSYPVHVFGRSERRSGPDRAPTAHPGGPGGGFSSGGAAAAAPGGVLQVDTFLSAPDILPRHCLVRAPRGGGPEGPEGAAATVRPFRGAVVTRNGTPVVRETPLSPGDLLGLGQHFLLLYRDPRGGAPSCPPPWLPPARPALGLGALLRCPGCGRPPAERQEGLRGVLEAPRAELRFRPQDQEPLLREIVRGTLPPEGDEPSEEGDDGVAPLAPAFLLGLCLEHAGTAFPPESLPPLLARVALLVKESVWEKIKEIGDRQPEKAVPQGAPLPPLPPPSQLDAPPPALAPVATDLRPLMLWLANGTELLSLAQARVLQLERDLEMESPSAELSGDLEQCDEALGVLDEVIMSTFQQSVYYLTKTLYSALPALLESNPFAGAGEPSAGGQDLASVPEGVRPLLAIFQGALELTRRCRLHPDLVSQTFGYLFFFCNASLFNALMDRGSSGPFFQWWRGVRIRTNLDLVLDWLTGLGLGDIAGDFFRRLSAAANLLCTPRSLLAKASWPRLRAEYPALTPAQLHHLLRHYQLGLGQSPPPAWEPPPEEREVATTGEILESLADHPPLLLPTQGFRLPLEGGGPVPQGLLKPLRRVRRFLWDLEMGTLPANQR